MNKTKGWKPPPSDDDWTEGIVDDLIGRVVLVGFKHVDPAGKIIEERQFFGHIKSARKEEGIVLKLAGSSFGETFILPPYPRDLIPAAPGKYVAPLTGETVLDPDYTCSWTMRDREDA